MSLKHNKKRNVFIIYEQLISLVTRLASQGNNTEANYIVQFIKENFNGKKEIGKQLKLMEEILYKKGYDKKTAEKILEETLNQISCLSKEKLEKEKTILIEKINRKISKDLFKFPIKTYKAAASAQMLINETFDVNKKISPTEKIKIKNLLINRISDSSQKKNEEKVDNLTLAIMCSKFNKRYANIMNEGQKEILSAWSTYLIDNNEKKMSNVLDNKISFLKRTLSKHIESPKHKGSDHEPFISESYNKLINNKYDLTEQSIYEVMRFYDLVEDLSNYNVSKEK